MSEVRGHAKVPLSPSRSLVFRTHIRFFFIFLFSLVFPLNSWFWLVDSLDKWLSYGRVLWEGGIEESGEGEVERENGIC